jgi:hypothetical protein
VDSFQSCAPTTLTIFNSGGYRVWSGRSCRSGPVWDWRCRSKRARTLDLCLQGHAAERHDRSGVVGKLDLDEGKILAVSHARSQQLLAWSLSDTGWVSPQLGPAFGDCRATAPMCGEP